MAGAKRLAIDAAVEQLGYRPNTIARSLVTRSTQTIALLLPDITNPFYAELVAGIHELTLERGYTMLLCTTDFDPEQEERYLRLLRAKHVDGALVDGLVLPPERIARFVEDGFPIVCLDRDVESPAVPLVQVDNRMGAASCDRAPARRSGTGASPTSWARPRASARSDCSAIRARWPMRASPPTRRSSHWATSPRPAGTTR